MLNLSKVQAYEILQQTVPGIQASIDMTDYHAHGDLSLLDYIDSNSHLIGACFMIFDDQLIIDVRDYDICHCDTYYLPLDLLEEVSA